MKLLRNPALSFLHYSGKAQAAYESKHCLPLSSNIQNYAISKYGVLPP